MAGSVILAGARTPIGKLSGLAGFSAAQLGGLAIRAALERAGLTPDQIDYVFMGQVLQAGAGQITARQAAVKAGIPMTVPATTVNKVCLSGLNTIYLADQMVQAGDADIVVAGGMESMTNAPYLLPQARAGYRYGDGTLVDSVAYDGLFCAFDKVAMGGATEKYAASAGIGREEQDELAAKSHDRAAAAIKDGRFADEIVPVEIPQRKGDPVLFDTDEGVRPGTTVESLGACARRSTRPATSPPATPRRSPTAAPPSSSPPRPRPRRSASHRSARSSATARSPAPTRRCSRSRPGRSRPALAKAGKSVSDVDLFELNEAFAAVGIASMKDLGITDEITNVNGGAIALGPPDRHVGQPPGPHHPARAAPPRRRARRRRALRRRRPGRRHPAAIALESLRFRFEPEHRGNPDLPMCTFLVMGSQLL